MESSTGPNLHALSRRSNHERLEPEQYQYKRSQYGERPLKPELYLGLFHGRDTADQKIDEWGYYGPAIKPLEYCHTTYATSIKIKFEAIIDGVLYFQEEQTCFDLNVSADLINSVASFTAPGLFTTLGRTTVRDRPTHSDRRGE